MNSLAQEWLTNKTRDEAIRLLTEAGIPAGPVNSVPDAFSDPQIKDREMIVNLEQPGIGKVPVSGIVVKMSETPGSIEAPAPAPGQHNEEIYCELLGYSHQDLDRFKKEGVV
jgi:crotonobetainyl-CoA:carnitine CoA-transferase CaiB-like acyl-CoA transferase